MHLGEFSLSLAVKDIQASRTFYEKLSFEVIDGNQSDGWLILQNGDTRIGLFQGMFEDNLLAFFPRDVRAIQAHLKAQGITLTREADEGDGPTHITLVDPDGNPIMFDQIPEDYKPLAQ
jgi:catechol 2,3-dioxygenase-like lactoylglutathione lyase family enzyme